MATVPVATGARMLGIHPKTLHHWLGEANVPLAAHPTDARIKCVAEEHLQEVARRHRRPLPDLPSALLLNGCSAPGSRAEPAQPPPTNEAEPKHPPASMPAPSVPETDLVKRLSCLETRIVTLQEQLAQLALTVLHERERTVEHRIAALESLIQPLMGGHLLADQQEQGARQEPACVSHRGHQPLAVEQRARSRMPALIEYGAQGTYVIESTTGRRVAPLARFGCVVCVAGEHLLVPLCGSGGTFHRLPRLQARAPNPLLESVSYHPPAQLQALVGRHRPTDDHPFGAGGGPPPGSRGRALIS
jgi:hypothetical protein